MRHPPALCFVVPLVLLLSGCNLPGSTAAVPEIGAVQTWIDAPLDGSTIPLAPYEIVLHAYDPAGVTQVELNANGSLLTTLPNANPGQHLATVKYLWSPAAPGNYTLTARGKSSNGLAGSAATAVITVAGSIPRPVITRTSVSATPTSTPTSTPTASPGPLAFEPRLSVSQFYSGTCTPNRVTIQVFVSGGNVSSVVLFQKLKDQASGVSTDWDDGSSMTPAGDGWFSRTVAAASVAGAESVGTAWLLYQFVATGNTGQVVGRSQVYSDIALSTCGAPPPSIITPRPGGIIVVPPILRFPSPTATLIPPPK